MDNENSSSKIHTVQPLRDLESNWGVDLVKSLEDYLLKICSGEISSGDDSHFSVNFAEGNFFFFFFCFKFQHSSPFCFGLFEVSTIFFWGNCSCFIASRFGTSL